MPGFFLSFQILFSGSLPNVECSNLAKTGWSITPGSAYFSLPRASLLLTFDVGIGQSELMLVWQAFYHRAISLISRSENFLNLRTVWLSALGHQAIMSFSVDVALSWYGLGSTVLLLSVTAEDKRQRWPMKSPSNLCEWLKRCQKIKLGRSTGL